MAPGVLDGGVPVDVREQPETEAVSVVGRVGEAVDDDAGLLRVEGLTDAVVEFVVDDGGPVVRLLVRDWLHVWVRERELYYKARKR